MATSSSLLRMLRMLFLWAGRPLQPRVTTLPLAATSTWVNRKLLDLWQEIQEVLLRASTEPAASHL